METREVTVEFSVDESGEGVFNYRGDITEQNVIHVSGVEPAQVVFLLETETDATAYAVLPFAVLDSPDAFKVDRDDDRRATIGVAPDGAPTTIPFVVRVRDSGKLYESGDPTIARGGPVVDPV